MLGSNSLLLDGGTPPASTPGEYRLLLPPQAAGAAAAALPFAVTTMTAIRAARTGTLKTWMDLRPGLAYLRNKNSDITRKGLANNAPWSDNPLKASHGEMLLLEGRIRLGLQERCSHNSLELPALLETYQEVTSGNLVLVWPDVLNWARFEYRIGSARAAVQLPNGPSLVSVDVVEHSAKLRERMVEALGTIRPLHQRQFAHVPWNPAPLQLPRGHPARPDSGTKSQPPAARQRRGRPMPPIGSRAAPPRAIHKGKARRDPPAVACASMAGRFMSDYE